MQAEETAGWGGDSLLGQGPAKHMSVDYRMWRVTLSSLTWPSACSPTLAREGAAQRGNEGARGPLLWLPLTSSGPRTPWHPGPALWALERGRLVGRQGVGWEDRSVSLPVSTLCTCHCMQPVRTLPGCEDPRMHTPSVPRPPTSFPPVVALPHRPGEDPGFFFRALVPVGRTHGVPHLPHRPGLLLWSSQKPKIWAELATWHRASYLPSPGAQCIQGTVAL